MKPIIRKKIVTFYPQGFIDTTNAYFIITDDDINRLFFKYLIKKEAVYETLIDDIQMVLVSLKRVVFFNINGIEIILDNMTKIKKRKKSITIGFCDYNNMQYETIHRFYKKNVFFSLYKTFKIATLFTTESIGRESILIWNKDYEQRNIQGIALFVKHYNAVVTHRKKEFLEHMSRANAYDDVVQDTFIGSVRTIPFARVSGSAVIYTLTGYLDASIDTQFDYAYHNKALRTGFKLFIFDMKSIISMNVKILDFFEKLIKDINKLNGTICIVNLADLSSLRKIKEELESMHLRFFKTLDEILNDKELLIELGGIIKEDHTHSKSVTKALINHLPSFIKATVSTLEMMLGISAVKARKVKIKELDILEPNQKLASSIGFYGDIEGIIILIFPFTLAKKSCSMMIGEDIHNLAEVLDSLAEFVNVIAGRVKTHLTDQEINISITLPRTYSSIDELLSTLTLNRGVQVDLNFNEETFTFFLTK